MLDYPCCQYTGDTVWVCVCLNGLSRKVLCVSYRKSMVCAESERQPYEGVGRVINWK